MTIKGVICAIAVPALGAYLATERPGEALSLVRIIELNWPFS